MENWDVAQVTFVCGSVGPCDFRISRDAANFSMNIQSNGPLWSYYHCIGAYFSTRFYLTTIQSSASSCPSSEYSVFCSAMSFSMLLQMCFTPLLVHAVGSPYNSALRLQTNQTLLQWHLQFGGIKLIQGC
jgi:hypothetical protein